MSITAVEPIVKPRPVTTAALSKALIYGLLIGGAIVALLPTLWMISASFMATGEANSYPPHFVPHAPTLEHYRALFGRLSLGRYLANSAFVSIAVTVLSLVVNSLAGYALAKLRFKGRDRLFRAYGIRVVEHFDAGQCFNGPDEVVRRFLAILAEG